jgi:hypothetical protein
MPPPAIGDEGHASLSPSAMNCWSHTSLSNDAESFPQSRSRPAFAEALPIFREGYDHISANAPCRVLTSSMATFACLEPRRY